MKKYTMTYKGEAYCSFERETDQAAIELTKLTIEEDGLNQEEVILYLFNSDEIIDLDTQEEESSTVEPSLTIHMEKAVTLMKDISNNKTAIWTVKYKELENELLNENEIVVQYCFGQLKKRVNLLAKLGYKLKNTIWFNDEAPYSKIKEVWTR
ncbi:hypothetical protein BAOM_3083 [Peribacillus asahii]|uniref:Uncharacterized protein n=1 Tax=Peribacillus asahii TaxID=228899 RepID=A0A3Q9RPD0_9BACI|nr:hypothetical protein [Peribacillus asahii]AZV43692.1 hypothetical protein BAOM_3083 [Peribacillus asahii]